jgi:hypothetical protein
MRRAFPQFIFTLLVLGMLLLREGRERPLEGIEETFIDWLAANSNAGHAEAPVTLVEINDNCLPDYPWPWSALDYGLFLEGALQFHARVAAIEPALAWDPEKLRPEEALQEPQFERFLHDCILRTPKLELGAQLGFPEDPDVLPPMQALPVLRNVQGATDAVPEYTIIEAEPGADIRLTAGLGFANVPATEPTAEHAPLVFRYRGQLVPSFVLEAMMLWHGVQPGDVEVRLGSEIRLGDKLTIPVNEAGAMPVDWKQPYERVGFDDLELSVDQLDKKLTPAIDPARLNDRLVILARTDAQSQIMLLPTGRMGSTGELFAEALATAETSAYARPGGWIGNTAVMLIAAALGWTLLGRRKLWVAPYVLVFAAAYLLLSLAVFETARVALPLTPMLGLIAFTAVFRLLAPDGGA